MPSNGADKTFAPASDGHAAWIAHARRLPVFSCDAVFRIASSVYIGPDNGMTTAEWEIARVNLPPIDLPHQFVDRVTTAEALDQEDALIRHYVRIIEILEACGKSTASQPFPYFRTQPAIIAGDEVLTEFPWTDSMRETQTVLDMLVGAERDAPRLLYDDQDQGWRMLIVAAEAGTGFMEWDGEGPAPLEGGYVVHTVELARQAGQARDRLKIIHSRLVRTFGQDYWML